MTNKLYLSNLIQIFFETNLIEPPKEFKYRPHMSFHI